MTIEKDVKVTESCLSTVWDPLTYKIPFIHDISKHVEA